MGFFSGDTTGFSKRASDDFQAQPQSRRCSAGLAPGLLLQFKPWEWQKTWWQGSTGQALCSSSWAGSQTQGTTSLQTPPASHLLHWRATVHIASSHGGPVTARHGDCRSSKNNIKVSFFFFSFYSPGAYDSNAVLNACDYFPASFSSPLQWL